MLCNLTPNTNIKNSNSTFLKILEDELYSSNCNTFNSIRIQYCPNLKSVEIGSFSEDFIVEINDCPLLEKILNYYRPFEEIEDSEDLDYSKYRIKCLYLNDGLHKLHNLDLMHLKRLEIKNINYDNLSILNLDEVDEVNVDFRNFTNLKTLCLKECNCSKSIVLITNKLEELVIDNCNVNDSISLKGDNNLLTRFIITLTKFTNLVIDKPLNSVTHMEIFKKEGNFPLVNLPKHIKHNMFLEIRISNSYHLSLKEFIKNNDVSFTCRKSYILENIKTF